MLLLSLLNPLSDQVLLEKLALLAQCSKEARSLTAPLLELQMRDKEQMRLLILRIFPTITGLPADRDAAYYRVLLNRYFSCGAPSTELEIFFALEYELKLTWFGSVQEITRSLLPAMQSALGRKMIRAAIADWRAALLRRHMDRPNRHRLSLLDQMELALQTDFAVLFDQINSEFDRR